MANFEKAPVEVQEILSKPIQQLGLKLEGSPLERFVQQLYKELVRRNAGCLLEVPLPLGKRTAHVIAQFQLPRVRANDECSPEIGFPVLKHRPQVEKDDVIIADRQIGRILRVWSQRVPARAHDALMPIGRNPVHLPGQLVDVGVQLRLPDAGANQPAPLNFVKEPHRIALGGAKFRDPLLLENVKSGICQGFYTSIHL